MAPPAVPIDADTIRRRLSQVLLNVGSPDEGSESDCETTGSPSLPCSPQSRCQQFNMFGGSDCGSSDMSEDDKDELERVFEFDQDAIARLLQQGVSQDVLEEAVFSSMQEKFRGRPRIESSEVVVDNTSGALAPTASATEAASPMMTPVTSPALTPREGLRARRSSMIMSNSRLSMAMDRLELEQSKRMAAEQDAFKQQLALETGSPNDGSISLVEAQAAKVLKQRRKSLLQAAEVVGLLAPRDDVALQEQISKLQLAVEGARRRHRQRLAQVEAMQEHSDPATQGGAPKQSVRQRLDKLAAAWVDQEENRKKMAAPPKRLPGEKKHTGYLALLKTRVSLLGRPPARCPNARRGLRRR
eukprot:TRINITY_DN87569_c0_g1_i1.p1 TRINITY_DN87569_c0_g1~~TRINITY_DN87569_c0_g1_i1.p1  ORF type:complete len:386 (-),score=80.97 TRINITY_DN87569_c0_g1_i1:44-1117(-)